MTLHFFSTLIECSGLKEEMGIEDAFNTILSTHEFWRCILTATGTKRDELWNEKLYIKARKTILEMKRAIEMKTLELNVFLRLQNNRELCFKCFTVAQGNHCEITVKKWHEIFTEFQRMKHILKTAIHLFQHAKLNINKNILPEIDFVELCLKFLEKTNKQLDRGNISIIEAEGLVSCKTCMDKMLDVCINLKETVKSKVFWNIFEELFNDFVQHLDTNSKSEDNRNDSLLCNALLYEDLSLKSLQNSSAFLRYLSSTVLKEYEHFWTPILSGNDVFMSKLLRYIGKGDIMQELAIAETTCRCTLVTSVLKTFQIYTEFKQHSKTVIVLKKVLDAFKVDVKKDQNFQLALSEYEKLVDRKIENMTLIHIGSSLSLIKKVIDVVDSDMLSILHEIQNSTVLIDFLQSVVNEDIRNLIDAVEEHSEQYVMESTVSSLIDVKRFLQPLLKQKCDDNIQTFFNVMKKSMKTIGLDGIEKKIKACSSNVHSLKALYNYVANRGEHTTKIIENIVNRGVFHFCLNEEECKVDVKYKLEEKEHSYSKTYLNDLRSRALLLLNTEQSDKTQTLQSRKKHLTLFIEIIDSALDIGNMCFLLKRAGNFDYIEFQKEGEIKTLPNVVNELKMKYEDWCKTLTECRGRFYLMNYINSDQLPLLYNFTRTGNNRESVIAMLKFMNPDVSNLDDILNILRQNSELNSPEENLVALGKTLERIRKRLVPQAEILFDKKPNSKISEIVQKGRLFVARLEPGSQLVVRTLLALYWHTNQKIPSAHNVLLCNRKTSQDDITLILNRCQGCKNKQLFCIAKVEMLAHDTQDFLVECLRKFQGNKNFQLALLCRENSNHRFLETFSEFVMLSKPLTDNELEGFFSNNYPNVLTVTSEIPGLGKSEVIQRFALSKEMSAVTLHISGIFERGTIVEELKKIEIKPYHVLHIDIGPIDRPFELDDFLFELIVLKHISAGKSAFHLQTEYICIEIANSVNEGLSNSLPTVTSFRKKHLEWDNYNSMHVCQEINSPIQVVCHYLNLHDSEQLNTTDVFFHGKQAVCPLSPGTCRELLRKHFSISGDMSYTIVNIFIGVLADQLKKLSSSVFFRTSNIQHQFVRKKLVNALKNMSMDFSTRSINACKAAQTASMRVVGPSIHNTKDTSKSSAEVIAERTKSMIRWEDSNHLMILFHQDLQTVSAIYRKHEMVPRQISNLFESQLGKTLDDFSKKGQQELKCILLKLVQHPSGIGDDALNIDGDQVSVETSKQYALTPDNLLKMVLIILRIQGRQPIIIMGETGCGKTSLIRYLSLICRVNFKILSIHAGVTEQIIIEKITSCDTTAKENLKTSVWLFLDEINTCDHLGLICDVLCHHHCKGKLLSPNLKIIAACNPYRLRSDESIFTSGLQGKIKTDQLSKLVYRVHPLPETMIDFVWDYGHLQTQDEKCYIKRMVQEVFKSEKIVQLLVNLLIMSQEYAKANEGSDCCVSLRDVERCKRLVVWFVENLAEKDKNKKYKPGELETTAMILALSICYHSRFTKYTVRKQYREKIAECCRYINELNLKDERQIKNIIVEQQNDILNRMELPLGTAKNTALRENVFVILVCIFNCIPVFIVGKPGCSKSLSMQLIRSNLRGKDSANDFFKTLPQLYCVSFQGSESSTSDGIIKVFEKAQNYQDHNKSKDVLSVVILDEIGLAEISRFNPLKVLHNLLEPDSKATLNVSVVGISNWALDAAKMNRAIHLSRPEMDMTELHETAMSITKSLTSRFDLLDAAPIDTNDIDEARNMPEEIQQLLKKLAHAYWVYNEQQHYKNFHGLRDFYSLTKYIGKNIILAKQKIDDVIIRGLLRNFGGLPNELRKSMLLNFQKCFDTRDNADIGVLDLIRDNLLDKQSRHLMLITNGDAVLSVIEDAVKQMKRQHFIIFGSQFEDDINDDYNYRILSRIMICMEQGYILILKDLENIYGSLYDMLNQNYTVIGSKKNCRVALGPYSNPMCHVHEDFKCIVLVEELKLNYSDPPFLNRFEKQQFRLEDMMNEKAKIIKDQLVTFTEELCKIEGYSYTPENILAISGENLISSLVLKVQKEVCDEDRIIHICQEHLLWITAPEAMMRINDTYLYKEKQNSVKQLKEKYFGLPIHNGLLKLLEFFNSNMCQEGGITLAVVFTHDHELPPLHTQCAKLRMERLRNFKSEKHLNTTIQDFFDSDFIYFLLHCNAIEDSAHILLAKSIIEHCMRSTCSKKKHEPKTVCIIIQMERHERTFTQINFLSGWKLVMIDKMNEPNIPLTEMKELTPEKILGNRALLNTIQNHIFWAFTTIQYVGTGHTAKQMVQVVHNIKEAEDCLSVLKELIFSSQCKSSQILTNNWHTTVAYDKLAILKAASFMNALEQYLLDIIKNPLGKIIFKIEEANAFDCLFLRDENYKKRLQLWRKLVMKESLMDVSHVPNPSGPECYTCCSERLCLNLPFSFIFLCRIEQIRDDFLNITRKINIYLKNAADDDNDNNEKERQEQEQKQKQEQGDDDRDEDNEENYDISISVLTKLALKYSDIVEQCLTEYTDNNYPEMFAEYERDFDIMMSSQAKGDLDEKEIMQIMKWTRTLFDTKGPHNEFTLHVTYLHVLHWLYGSVFNSILTVMDMVKQHTHASVESFFKEEKTTVHRDTKRRMLVDNLCKTYLPTSNLMTHYQSVEKWLYLVKGVLPYLADISLKSQSIHMLRFCSDVAQALIPLNQDATMETLKKIGDFLTENSFCEMFDFLMTLVKILQENTDINIETIQRIICQYILRTLAIDMTDNVPLKCLLTYMSQNSEMDRNLQYFEPVVRIVLMIEEKKVSLTDLIDIDVNSLGNKGYLHALNHCIECVDKNPDSVLPTLLVAALKDCYQENLSQKTLRSIKGNSDKIIGRAITACDVLRKCTRCSLNLVSSIAYMQALIHAYIVLLEQNKMNADAFPVITKAMNALLESGDKKNNLEVQRTQALHVYFVKCLSSIVEAFELEKYLNALKNSLPMLTTLHWENGFRTSSMTFNPLFLYKTDDDRILKQVLFTIEKADLEKLKKIEERVLFDCITQISFVGCLADSFYLKRQQEVISDSQKTLSKRIFKIIESKLPQMQCKVVELLLNITDFAHPLFHIDTETRSPNIQIVSVLIHLLSLIIFKGETGNIWKDILLNMNNMQDRYIPGNSSPNIKKPCNVYLHTCNFCKIRFARTVHDCPKCQRECESDVTKQEENETPRECGYEKPEEQLTTSTGTYSPVTCHFMQFVIHGCILLSYCIKPLDICQLENLICEKKNPEDKLSEILFMKWNFLKHLTDMDDEDLCAMFHVVIHDMETIFTLKESPFHCKTFFDCEQVENKIQSCLQLFLEEKYMNIGKARKILCKRLGVDAHSLESQFKEISTIEEVHDKALMVPRLFRMTSPASKQGLIAQVWFGQNPFVYPFLRFVLEKEDILLLPKFILPIVQWHQLTVSFGSYKMKKVDCKDETIKKFLGRENDETQQQQLYKTFEKFETSWNELIKKHRHLFRYSLKEDDAVSFDSKVSSCIITDEKSIIFEVLKELVHTQNYILDNCLQFASISNVPALYSLKTGEQFSQVKAISLWDLKSKNIIKFRAFKNSFLRYSQCKSGFGEKRDRFFDLQKIESELAHELILGKPYIHVATTFPRVLFIDELFQNTIQLLNNTKKAIPQEKLPEDVLKIILKNKDEKKLNITEFMTVIGMSMSLIKKIKGKPKSTLTTYLKCWEDVSVLQKTCKNILTEMGDTIMLCHVVHLYVKLEEFNGEFILKLLGSKFKDNLPSNWEERISSMDVKYVDHLAVLEESLKIFVHRYLEAQDDSISINLELVQFMMKEHMWPQGYFENGHIAIGNKKLKLEDILWHSLRVKHIYNAIRCIQDFVQVSFVCVLFSS